MDTRIAIVGIIIENYEMADKVNNILHTFGKFIVGRIGVPYREKGINVISIIMDSETSVINSLTGKIGMLDGVTAKAIFSNK